MLVCHFFHLLWVVRFVAELSWHSLLPTDALRCCRGLWGCIIWRLRPSMSCCRPGGASPHCQWSTCGPLGWATCGVQRPWHAAPATSASACLQLPTPLCSAFSVRARASGVEGLLALCLPMCMLVVNACGLLCTSPAAKYSSRRFGPTRFSVISAAAVGQLSVRFVAAQDPDELVSKLRAHLEAEFEVLHSRNTLSLKVESRGDWWEADPKSPIFQAAARVRAPACLLHGSRRHVGLYSAGHLVQLHTDSTSEACLCSVPCRSCSSFASCAVA
jgi:hypothetical protein